MNTSHRLSWRAKAHQYLGALVGAAAISLSAQTSAQFTSVDANAEHQRLTDRVIIKFKGDKTAAQVFRGPSLNTMAANNDIAFKPLRKTAFGSDVVSLGKRPNKQSMAQLIAQLNAHPDIEYAEPDLLLQPMATPTDPRYNEQWHYFESTGGLNLPNAWDTTAGAGVVVAVVDTGYLPHADLVANLLPGYDMIDDTFVSQDGDGRDNDATDVGDWAAAGVCSATDPGSNSSWHGTHVAGTVAAAANNGIGVAGVAYDAQIVPVRALGRCGGYTSDIADGIVWAAGGSVSGTSANANPAQVINLSLGGAGSCGSTTQSAINTARNLGATIVVAAGNSNTNASNATPANCNGVITVAATNRSGGRSYYSNFGSVVDVGAPGGELTASTSINGVLSTLNSGSSSASSDTYSFYQGTSMAAPHVAGAAALLYAEDPSITPDEVESILTDSARSFPSTCSQCGSGIVDATAALALLSGDGGGGTGGGELANGVEVTGLAASTGVELNYTLEVPAGATDLSFTISGGSGDADLYVRYGAEPTTSTYDCRPYLNGNNETCDISSVQAGTYYVMVRAYSTFSGVSLEGSYTENSGGGSGGGIDLNEQNLSGSRRTWRNYSVDVPAGTSSLTVTMSGGSGDADLYVRGGSVPTSSSYDCRPYLNGNNETCTISSPNAGTWYISIYAFRTYSGVSLVAQ